MESGFEARGEARAVWMGDDWHEAERKTFGACRRSHVVGLDLLDAVVVDVVEKGNFHSPLGGLGWILGERL